MNPPLIIDKSFAHASNSIRLRELAEQFTILVPSAFFYEVARVADLEMRSKAIKAFPEFQMLHIPSLLRIETNANQPLIKLEYKAHSFNPDFVSGERPFSKAEEEVL